MTQTTETVIRKSITVEAPLERTFEVFTAEIATWWPMRTHSVGEDKVAHVAIEGAVGGRLYERWQDGEERDWGTVTAWEPPSRVAFTWHPGRGPETAQDVEVRFTAEGGRTRVDLEHRGWERLGDRMNEVAARYDSGWDEVLGRRFAGAFAAQVR
jgi:uncharacterized protein YndB with AHSA1/START domain